MKTKLTAEEKRIKAEQKQHIVSQLDAGFRMMSDPKTDQYSLDLMSEIILEQQKEITKLRNDLMERKKSTVRDLIDKKSDHPLNQE